MSKATNAGEFIAGIAKEPAMDGMLMLLG